MKNYYFYDPSTGEFTGQSISSNVVDDTDFVALNTPANLKCVEYYGNITNCIVNLVTGAVEPKSNPELTTAEIKNQIYIVREQYLSTGNAELKTQLDLLQTMLLNSES